MIMANREFLKNRNIDERNSLPDLMQNISPDSEEEINFIDHSRRAPMWQQSGTLQFCSCHGIAGFLVDELEI